MGGRSIHCSAWPSAPFIAVNALRTLHTGTGILHAVCPNTSTPNAIRTALTGLPHVRDAISMPGR
ncbi:MAG: hypothetical protein IPL77_21785 [Flavobacteriales bacterium]|nr:hypothetical protein [Flavobacteriales bacterium]